MDDAGGRVAVGTIARAHGLRGRVLLAPYNPDSEGLERLRELWLGDQRMEVERTERVNLGYLVALRGVANRDQADALRGLEVSVPREALPALEEGELYAVDLVGMAVVDGQGAARGAVLAIEEAGPQDLLVVRGEDGAERLVPLALVKEVDGGARRIVVDAPEGLFDL